mmetsp:Transcript_17986/g.51889  ORF Transcript_17986/g.51889 Transcript_17986/m.51889 type:complete len:429 (-) Transcript_17986:1016-2302(-)
MVGVALGLEVQPEDEVAVVSLRILVHGRVVRPMGPVVDAHRLEARCGGGHVDGGHAHKQLLRLGLVQPALLAIPAAALDEEAMDVLPLVGHIADALVIVRQDLGVRGDVVQRPLILLVLPRHLLPHAGQEPLRIRETREPIGFHDLPAVLQPCVQHQLPVRQASKPAAQVRHQPRDLRAARVVRPPPRHAGVEDGAQVLEEVRGHDDRAVDGHGDALQVHADDGDDALQTLQLLEEEDVQRRGEALVLRLRRALQLLDLRAEDLLHEVWRHLAQQVQRLLLDDLVHGFAASTPAVLRLRLDDRSNHLRGFFQSVSEVGVRVEAKDEWRVDRRNRLNAFTVLLDLQALWDLVVVVGLVVVEGESRLEDLVAEPLQCVRVEQLAVQVVRNAATILRLGDHVLHGYPGDRLANHHRCRHVLLQELEAGIQV